MKLYTSTDNLLGHTDSETDTQSFTAFATRRAGYSATSKKQYSPRNVIYSSSSESEYSDNDWYNHPAAAMFRASMGRDRGQSTEPLIKYSECGSSHSEDSDDGNSQRLPAIRSKVIAIGRGSIKRRSALTKESISMAARRIEERIRKRDQRHDPAFRRRRDCRGGRRRSANVIRIDEVFVIKCVCDYFAIELDI